MKFITRTLGEICDETGGFIRTGPFGSQLHGSDYVEQGIPVVMPKNIIDNKIAPEDIAQINEEDAQRLSAHRLKQGDIIYGRRGDIGRHAIITQKEAGWLCGTGCLRISGVNRILEPLFLHYYLGLPEIVSWIANHAIGATLPNLNTSILRGVKVAYPSLPVQRTIAGILSAYDDLIENNARRIAILEEMARALYHEWFVKFRFPGYENVKMVESELGIIPEGWEIKPVGETMQILGGGTPSTKENEYWDDGDIVWFSPTDLTSAGTMFISDSAKKITPAGLQHCSARMFPAYSVMMTSRATIGVIAINTKPACTNQGFITCLANERLSTYQIYHWIEQNRQKIISLASGATFKEINKATFRQLPVIVPPIDVSQQFNQTVHPIYKVVENLISRNTSLRRARDLLLPKLISGEIDVSGWAGAGVYEEMAESLVGGPGARRVAEAPDVGTITPIDRDALQWRSLWDE